MNDEKGNKKGKKSLIAGGVAMLLTGVIGINVPPDVLLEVWGWLPWS